MWEYGDHIPRQSASFSRGVYAGLPTFEKLLEQLRSDAARICAQSTMKEVRVIGIDFH
jgi:hypothetical protein